MSDIFETDTNFTVSTYILDNYGHQALEAVNDWKSNGASSRDALSELIGRFRRVSLLGEIVQVSAVGTSQS